MPFKNESWTFTSPTFYYGIDGAYGTDCTGITVKDEETTTTEVTLECSTELDSKEVKEYFTPEKIIYNGPCTIVFWSDGTKTIVRLAEGDIFNPYNAFNAALAKKIFGTNNEVKRIVETGEVIKDKKEKKKKEPEKKPETKVDTDGDKDGDKDFDHERLAALEKLLNQAKNNLTIDQFKE